MLDDVDEEAQQQVVETQTEDEEVLINEGFAEERLLRKELVELEKEVHRVVVPNHEISHGLGTTKNLIDEGISELVAVPRDIRRRVA